MNRALIAIIMIVLCAFYEVSSVTGVDVSQLGTTAIYTCLKSNKISFTILRAYCSYGGVDKNAVAGLQNAKAAGLISDIYMFPCRGKNATSQVDQLMAAVPSSAYGMIWVDVETNPSTGCSWNGHDANSNCAFLMEIINRIKSKGKTPGIYSSKYMWQPIFGTYTACPAAASQQLWYAHYDNSPSFSDFDPFGGWTKPKIKQYLGDKSLCGIGIDYDYYP